jgi:hypothetical protein
MNDATRELGAALGVAVLGSIAASQYSSHLHNALGALPANSRAAASSSIAGALHAAGKLAGPASEALVQAARIAFVDGIHLAALFGVGLAVIAAVLTTRFLPRTLPTEGAMHSPVGALEDVLELGIGGMSPLFDDDPRRADSNGAPVRIAERSP